MAKLAVPAFNKKFRFRNSRSYTSVARCQICLHNVQGYCFHPERSRRVILSEPKEFGQKGERTDWSCWKVCDAVEVGFPEDFIVPKLPEGHFVITSPAKGSHANPLEHTDPHCPYIAAMVRDEGFTEFGGRSFRIADRSKAQHSDDPCELPNCRKNLPPPWRPEFDGYLSGQGFEYGYIPKQPKSLDDGQPEEPLSEHELAMRIASFPGGAVTIRWTEEAIEQAVRFVKRLIFPNYSYDPKEKVYQGHPIMDWYILAQVLPLVGWGEVVGRINFEIAVKLHEETYCINCGLHNDDREYHFENPVRGHHGRPVCPNCGNQLTSWPIFIQRMPQ